MAYSVWLTQRQIAELFGTKVPAISKHLKNIFASGELQEDMVISKMETTTRHGAISGKTQTKDTNFYNLDAILSVGYRVNSKNATAFRIWANQVLKQYLLQGFAIFRYVPMTFRSILIFCTQFLSVNDNVIAAYRRRPAC